jgi:hypothetical protein
VRGKGPGVVVGGMDVAAGGTGVGAQAVIATVKSAANKYSNKIRYFMIFRILLYASWLSRNAR